MSCSPWDSKNPLVKIFAVCLLKKRHPVFHNNKNSKVTHFCMLVGSHKSSHACDLTWESKCCTWENATLILDTQRWAWHPRFSGSPSHWSRVILHHCLHTGSKAGPLLQPLRITRIQLTQLVDLFQKRFQNLYSMVWGARHLIPKKKKNLFKLNWSKYRVGHISGHSSRGHATVKGSFKNLEIKERKVYSSG